VHPKQVQNSFFLGLVLLVSAAFLYLISGYFQPIFWAAILGVLFLPVQYALERRLRNRPSLVAVLTVILIFFTVLVPSLLVTSAVVNEAAHLYQRIQSGEIDPGAALRWLQGWMPGLTSWAEGIGIDVGQWPQKVSDIVVKASQYIGGKALTAGQNVANFMIKFLIMLYLLFFILRDGDQMMEKIIAALPFGDDRERELFGKFAEVSRATLKGTLVIGIVQGALGGLAFAVVGIKGAAFWATIMAVMSIVPAVGTALVWIPAVVYLLLTGHVAAGIGLLVWCAAVVGSVDNLLRPRLVGGDTEMPDLLILLSTLGGLSMFGAVGLIIGPVIAGIFLTVWEIYGTTFRELLPDKAATSE